MRSAPEDTARLVVGREAFAAALAEIASAVRLQLSIQTFGFEASLYGDEALVERIKEFCLSHERARVRVLVNQPALAMRGAHRFVELGRRLSSRIQFRQLDDEDHGVVDECVIADEQSLLWRDQPERLEARLALDAPLQARLRLKTFNERWERALPAREFSELGI